VRSPSGNVGWRPASCALVSRSVALPAAAGRVRRGHRSAMGHAPPGHVGHRRHVSLARFAGHASGFAYEARVMSARAGGNRGDLPTFHAGRRLGALAARILRHSAAFPHGHPGRRRRLTACAPRRTRCARTTCGQYLGYMRDASTIRATSHLRDARRQDAVARSGLIARDWTPAMPRVRRGGASAVGSHCGGSGSRR
jgi:hypothetical protein